MGVFLWRLRILLYEKRPIGGHRAELPFRRFVCPYKKPAGAAVPELAFAFVIGGTLIIAAAQEYLALPKHVFSLHPGGVFQNEEVAFVYFGSPRPCHTKLIGRFC